MTANFAALPAAVPLAPYRAHCEQKVHGGFPWMFRTHEGSRVDQRSLHRAAAEASKMNAGKTFGPDRLGVVFATRHPDRVEYSVIPVRLEHFDNPPLVGRGQNEKAVRCFIENWVAHQLRCANMDRVAIFPVGEFFWAVVDSGEPDMATEHSIKLAAKERRAIARECGARGSKTIKTRL